MLSIWDINVHSDTLKQKYRAAICTWPECLRVDESGAISGSRTWGVTNLYSFLQYGWSLYLIISNMWIIIYSVNNNSHIWNFTQILKYRLPTAQIKSTMATVPSKKKSRYEVQSQEFQNLATMIHFFRITPKFAKVRLRN